LNQAWASFGQKLCAFSQYYQQNPQFILSRDEVITPYELFTGIKADVSTLRVFGCVCYAFVPKEKRATKLDLTSVLGIYRGYSNDSCRLFRLFNPVTKKFFSARNVHVLENSFIQNVRYIDRNGQTAAILQSDQMKEGDGQTFDNVLKKIPLTRKRIEEETNVPEMTFKSAKLQNEKESESNER
jgi:hypothetical protein